MGEPACGASIDHAVRKYPHAALEVEPGRAMSSYRRDQRRESTGSSRPSQTIVRRAGSAVLVTTCVLAPEGDSSQLEARRGRA